MRITIDAYFDDCVNDNLVLHRYVICVEKNEGHSLVVPSVELAMQAPDAQDAYDVASKY